MLATVIIVIILAVIIVAAILSYRRKLTRGCCGAGGDPVEKIRTDTKNPADYPFQYTITIEGMTCKNCAVRIENKFNQTDGYLAKVNLHKNSALIRSKTDVTDGDLKSIVARAGYHITSIQRL